MTQNFSHLGNDDINFILKNYSEKILQYLETLDISISFFPDSEFLADSIEAVKDTIKILDHNSLTIYQDFSFDEKDILTDMNLCKINEFKFIKMITPFTRERSYDFIIGRTDQFEELVKELTTKRDSKNKGKVTKIIGLPIEEIEKKTIDFLLDDKLRAFCKERDIPLKRGIIFEGQPGVGKSYTLKYLRSKAEANDISFEVFTDVKSFLENVEDYYRDEKKIFVFEDFDTALLDRDSSDGTPSQVLGKILNTLDGVKEIDNVVSIFTTNKVKLFDNAFIRPGRIDTVFTFSLPSEENIKEFLQSYLFDYDVDFIFNELKMIKSSVNVSYAFLKGISNDINIFFFFNERQPNDSEIRNIIEERSSQMGKGSSKKSQDYIL